MRAWVRGRVRVRVRVRTRVRVGARVRARVIEVELGRAPEVGHRLLVLALERVVVADDAARLGPVLVHLHTGVREARELALRLLDV